MEKLPPRLNGREAANLFFSPQHSHASGNISQGNRGGDVFEHERLCVEENLGYHG